MRHSSSGPSTSAAGGHTPGVPLQHRDQQVRDQLQALRVAGLHRLPERRLPHQLVQPRQDALLQQHGHRQHLRRGVGGTTATAMFG